MSSKSEDTGSLNGGTGGGAQQSPRLLPGTYAAWRPHMDVYLQRSGAENIHTDVLDEKQWTDTVQPFVTQ